MLNREGSRLRRRVSAFALACLLLLPSADCFAWGAGGHMMVAYIAYHRLNSKAKREVNRLLAIPINPAAVTRKSKDFVNASHWADDLRPVPDFKFSLVEHFSDFPFSVDGTPVPTDQPAEDNIVVALEKNLETLKTRTDDDARAGATLHHPLRRRHTPAAPLLDAC
jgi:hypothetical protein